MEEMFSNNIPSFKQFLSKFHNATCGSVTEDDTFPFRLVTYYISRSDAEGECIDWILQYLTQNKCPPVLALNIARAVSSEFKTTDLIELYQAKQSLEEQKVDYVPQIEASRFAQAVFHKVHKVCSLWHNDLPKICLPDVCYEVSSHAIKNSRRKMEDRHMVIQDLNSLFELKDYPSQSYYAVFDGHGGLDAAWYSAAHVHMNLVRQPMFRDDPLTALRNAFLKTDEDFDIKAKNEGLRSGCTAVAVLLRDRTLYLSWLGDSQAILVKDGTPMSIMSPHKPEREDEKNRVEALGGCVVWFGAWRVNGSLSVSRAIGDTEHKPYISSEPDTFSYELDGIEDYIVIACDGLWDSISPKNLTSLVYNYIKEDGNRGNIANKLISVARDEGSSDNISVIVVFLRENIGVPPSSLESDDEKLKLGESEKDGTNENEKADGSVDMGNADLSPGASPGGVPDNPGPPSGDPGAQDTEIRAVSFGKTKSKSSAGNSQKASPTHSPRQQKNQSKMSLTIDVGSTHKESGQRGLKGSRTSDAKSPTGIIGQRSPLSPKEKHNQFPSLKEKVSSSSVKSPSGLKDRTSDINSGKFYPSPMAASIKQKKSSSETISDGANVTSSGSNTAASAKQISSKVFATMPASVRSPRSPVPVNNRKVLQSDSLK